VLKFNENLKLSFFDVTTGSLKHLNLVILVIIVQGWKIPSELLTWANKNTNDIA
jgi:hypothetical protein